MGNGTVRRPQSDGRAASPPNATHPFLFSSLPVLHSLPARPPVVTSRASPPRLPPCWHSERGALFVARLDSTGRPLLP